MRTRVQIFAVILLTAASPWVLADDEERTINNEAEIKLTVELQQEFESNACKAELEVEYYQKGDSVRVDAVLTNSVCAASSGSYVMKVRYRGDDGETKMLEFPEVWQRSDAAPVESGKDYFIAENVDVIRVRSSKLRCVCAAADATTTD